MRRMSESASRSTTTAALAGTIHGNSISGVVRRGAGDSAQWIALRIPPGSVRWPVLPRVTVRQLMMGTSAVVDNALGAWVRVIPDTAVLEHEYRDLARGTARHSPNAPRVKSGHAPPAAGVRSGRSRRRAALHCLKSPRDLRLTL